VQAAGFGDGGEVGEGVELTDRTVESVQVDSAAHAGSRTGGGILPEGPTGCTPASGSRVGVGRGMPTAANQSGSAEKSGLPTKLFQNDAAV
jgi:hypothetical protein